jgi:hypothetical protein
MERTLRFNYSKHTGYDISLKGDNRYCKIVAKLANGKTVQEEFNERIKSLPQLEPETFYPYLLGVYRQWAYENPLLLKELAYKALTNSNCVRDKLAVGVLSHARALVQILNEDYPM